MAGLGEVCGAAAPETSETAETPIAPAAAPASARSPGVPGTLARLRKAKASLNMPAHPWLAKGWRFFASPYAALPPAPKGRWPRIALILLAALTLAFVIYFTAYTWAMFDTFRSSAEDMGIMDQAIWNTLHGAVLHQTICNSISDSNCLGDISRFAIHFEPIMLPLALLYVVAPSPKSLMLLQVLVVASGAYPVYWIACRRLASPLAGLIFALAYLLYPAVQGALLFDFHAVTLTIAFLLFAIYFMLTRNNRGLVIACVLALSTKEEVPLDIIMLGLAILCLQRRWRVGLGLIGLSCAWLGMTLIVMHIFSPLGHSPTAERYSYLGDNPVQAAGYILTHPIQLLQRHLFDASAQTYLRTLLGPLAYLGILSPFTLVLGLPALLINLLSSDPSMHRGLHQYSAEIIPFMLFSAISGAALALRLARWAIPHLRPLVNRTLRALRQRLPVKRLPALTAAAQPRILRATLLLLLMALVLCCLLQQGIEPDLNDLPGTSSFSWPELTPHRALADTVVSLIPAGASVSAQDMLVAHLSHRRAIYQYPYMAAESQYVVLDTLGYIYPFTNQNAYNQSINALLTSGQFTVIFNEDGYLVLQHIPPPSSP
jgi:uncharacterized membrane protein